MEIKEVMIVIVYSAPAFMGIFWIYGTWRNWKVFMDPSDVLWFMYFWHFTKKYFGEEGMKILNYSFGVLLLIGGIYFFTLLYKMPTLLNF